MKYFTKTVLTLLVVILFAATAAACDKANPVITRVPAAIENLVYDGKPHNLVAAGEVEGGEFRYSPDGGDYSSDIPTGTDAGKHVVYYKVFGGERYNDTTPETVECFISPKTVELSSKTDFTITGNTGYTGNVIMPKIEAKDGDRIIPRGEYTLTYENNVDLGEAEFILTDREGGNYTVNGRGTFTVTKGEPVVTGLSAVENLIYDGTDKRLLTKCSVKGGQISYCLSEKGEYSADPPMASDAKDYTVWYKIDGDEKYNDVGPKSIICTIRQLKFSPNGTAYTVTGTEKAIDEIVIPSTYKGKPVTKIGKSAFSGCFELTSITIPESVLIIEESAFSGCSYLTSITVPDSVKEIGDYAFGAYWVEYQQKYLTSLCSVVIGNGVTGIGKNAFEGCAELTSITVPDSVTIIGDNAFSGCSKLTAVDLSQNLTTIGENAFKGCACLTSIAIPGKVRNIGRSAFSGCAGIESISVDKKNPGYHSTGNCIIKTADKILIAGCKNSVIPFDGSVTSIEDGAFEGCAYLTSVNIPDGVKRIGISAFRDCLSLRSVIVPDSVTSIGKNSFSGCTKLTLVTFKGTKEQWNKINDGRKAGIPQEAAGAAHCSDGDAEV